MITDSFAPAPPPHRVSHVRILYVTDGFAPFRIGGMQTVARRQIETLVTAGLEVISISSNDNCQPNGLDWRNVSIPWPRRPLIQKLSPFGYAYDLEKFSIDVARIADELQPDVVYSEGPLIAAYLKRPRAERAPTIFHPHGLEMFQPKGSLLEDAKSWPLRSIVRLHAGSADVVLCLGRGGALQKILTQQCGARPQRVITMPNAVSIDQPFARVPKLRRAGGRLLFVGRNEPRKGVSLLLRAFQSIKGATLDIIGDHAMRADAPACIRAHGEVRDRTRIRQFMRAADFLVVPSYAEGLPTVILEAFAQATPVIATDVGANADAVRTGETGFLVPPGDAFALREVIRTALELQDADYARMSAKCLEEACTTYSPDTVGDQLVGLVRRMTSGGAARKRANV